MRTLKSQRHGLLAAAALAGATLGLFLPVRAEPQAVHKPYGESRHCALMPVTSVRFENGGARGWYLYIGGWKQAGNMRASLNHRSYGGGTLTVEVVGCTPNFVALPVKLPFTVEVPLRQLPAARSIRVVGANGTLVRRLPGR